MHPSRQPLTSLVAAIAFAVAATGWGCATADPQTGQALDQFQSAYKNMAGQFGDGKADLLGGLLDPCPLLNKIAPYGHDLVRAGLILGVRGDEVLRGVQDGGFELVWDLYHDQFTVARYVGSGYGTGLGVAGHAYVGEAFGFEHGVSEWDGRFGQAELDIGLPFLKSFLSVGPAVFASGVDENGDGVISPSEIITPPNGVYGFSMGVKLSFNILPQTFPIGGSLTQGLRQPYKGAIRHFYDDFKATRMFWVRKMHVHLVDAVTGEACPDGWPDVDGDRDCVIKFGENGDSYVSRAVDTAYSICHVTGRCAVPLSWPLAGEALAIGALRQSGLSLDELCPAN